MYYRKILFNWFSRERDGEHFYIETLEIRKLLCFRSYILTFRKKKHIVSDYQDEFTCIGLTSRKSSVVNVTL